MSGKMILSRTQRVAAAKVDPKVVEQTILDECDDLLDEIDNLLEDQDFLVNYRQKGGE